VRADATNAAAHYNASQLHVRRFEYTASNDELKQASAIDFDLVRQYQARAGTGHAASHGPVAAPRMFWAALGSAPAGSVAQPLPLILRGRMESAGLPFSLATLLAVGLGHLGRALAAPRLPLEAAATAASSCAGAAPSAARSRAVPRVRADRRRRRDPGVLARPAALQHRARRRDGARLARTALAR